jgi:hypothetical protein
VSPNSRSGAPGHRFFFKALWINSPMSQNIAEKVKLCSFLLQLELVVLESFPMTYTNIFRVCLTCLSHKFILVTDSSTQKYV